MRIAGLNTGMSCTSPPVKIVKTQRAIERKMTGGNLVNKKTNTWIRSTIDVTDVREYLAKVKWSLQNTMPGKRSKVNIMVSI